VISVPAGTIHAIGAGLVIAEVQQRSEATFRLFDYGRRRELHVERAIAVANTRRADIQVQPSRLTYERTLLVSNPHFVFERIELPADSIWSLQAERETWLLVLEGQAIAGPFNLGKGDAIFACSERVDVDTGKIGLTGLVAYAAHSPLPNLLQRLGQPGAADAGRPKDVQGPSSPKEATAHLANGRTEAI
jgi:mannose-6-phosphate isomerase